jgi:hypothetical protein
MSREPFHPSLSSGFVGTRDEFVRALKSLGASVEATSQPARGYDPCRVLLQCSEMQWGRIFGPVELVTVQFGPGGEPAFQAWRYHCLDGAVLCIGRQCERRGVGSMITVRAIYFD